MSSGQAIQTGKTERGRQTETDRGRGDEETSNGICMFTFIWKKVGRPCS